MGDSNPRGCYPNTLSKMIDGVARWTSSVRVCRSATCSDWGGPAWTDRHGRGLLPGLLPERAWASALACLRSCTGRTPPACPNGAIQVAGQHCDAAVVARRVVAFPPPAVAADL